MLFHLRSGGGAVGMLVPDVVAGQLLACVWTAVRVPVPGAGIASTIATAAVMANAVAAMIQRERVVNIARLLHVRNWTIGPAVAISTHAAST
jgi:hypothetical protein